MLLVNCSSCKTPLQLPPGATTIRCAVCRAITHVFGTPRGTPSLLPPPYFPPPPTGPTPTPPPPPTAPSCSLSSRPLSSPSLQPLGRKKAVICAVSYKNTKFELKGCINDAKCMKFLLVNRFKFPETDILVLTEEEGDPYRIPTGNNIRMAMAWLVVGCRAGDSLVFHYSGHGSQLKNYNGDELDGFDETLCPMDFETKGMILDDEINDTIVKPLPSGVKLHAIIDACHSGTVLDLPFLCRMNRNGQYEWEDHRPRSGRWKGTSGGEVISFSGCDDNQTSADTSALSKVASTGAMTYCFIQAIEKGQADTYGNMLKAMRAAIRSAGSDSGVVVTSLITTLLAGGGSIGLGQEPQLTANEPFDVYTKPFSL